MHAQDKDPERMILLRDLQRAVLAGKFADVSNVEDLIGKLPVVHLIRHGETAANVEKRINPAAKYIPDAPYTVKADTAYSYDDVGEAGLTEKGQQQAIATAQQLAQTTPKPTALFTSPQERAYDTIKAAAQELDVQEIEVCPDLREREFGPYAGIPIPEVGALCEARNKEMADGFQPDELIGALSDDGHVTAHWFNQTPKFQGEETGETWKNNRARGSKELVRILAEAVAGGHDSIGVGSHGDTTRMIVAAVRGAGWRDLLAHENDYLGSIKNGQVITLDMNELLQELLARQPERDRGQQ